MPARPNPALVPVAVLSVLREVEGQHAGQDDLERLPLGTPYPDVARRVAGVAANVEVRAGRPVHLPLYVDATGVGQPIVNLLTGAGIAPTPVYFTHGDRFTAHRDGTVTLGKALLVSQLQILLQSGRILLPCTMEARVLGEELLNYEIHVDERANDVYGAFRVGTHDDIVTALGLAVLAAERSAPAGVWFAR